MPGWRAEALFFQYSLSKYTPRASGGRQTDTKTHRHKDRQTDTKTDRQTDRQTKKQRQRQSDRE